MTPPPKALAPPMTQIMIAGCPNSGKSTVFNLLSQLKSKVGNWSGVTVDRISSVVTLLNETYELLDLPGTYSLFSGSENLDERIARRAILEEDPRLIVQVLDATRLSQQLYFTLQLMELGRPIVLLVNKIDCVHWEDTQRQALEERLGVRVFAFSAKSRTARSELLGFLGEVLPRAKPSVPIYPGRFEAARAAFLAQGLSERDAFLKAAATPRLIGSGERSLRDADPEALERARMHLRGEMIRELSALFPEVLSVAKSARIDALLLHPLWGTLVFLLAIYLVFSFTFTLGGAISDFCGNLGQTLFIDLPRGALLQLHTPLWLVVLLCDGVGNGLNIVFSWWPLPFFLFFMITFAEDCGYIARVACLFNALASRMGLSGRAMIPLILGFGCTIPAILATRVLPSPRERAVTAMISPFVSCTAKLPIYAVFSFVFFPHSGGLVMLFLYLLGLLVAIFTAFSAKWIFKSAHAEPLLLDLPLYQTPDVYHVLRTSLKHALRFLRRAAKYVIGLVTLVALLQYFGVAKSGSLLDFLGQKVTLLFGPIGIDPAHWPLVAGLIPGLLAKEVLLGSVNAAYAHTDFIMQAPESWSALLLSAKDSLITSFSSFLGGLPALPSQLFVLTLTAQAPESTLSGLSTLSTSGALGFLVFVLLYPPCITAINSLYQEFGKRWATLSLAWSIGIAYLGGMVTYRLLEVLRGDLWGLATVFWVVLGILGSVWVLRQLVSYMGLQRVLKTLLPTQRALHQKNCTNEACEACL